MGMQNPKYCSFVYHGPVANFHGRQLRQSYICQQYRPLSSQGARQWWPGRLPAGCGLTSFTSLHPTLTVPISMPSHRHYYLQRGAKIFHELRILDLGRTTFEGTAVEPCTSRMDHGITGIRPPSFRNPHIACCCVHLFLAAQIAFSGDCDTRGVIIAAIGFDVCIRGLVFQRLSVSLSSSHKTPRVLLSLPNVRSTWKFGVSPQAGLQAVSFAFSWPVAGTSGTMWRISPLSARSTGLRSATTSPLVHYRYVRSWTCGPPRLFFSAR